MYFDQHCVSLFQNAFLNPLISPPGYKPFRLYAHPKPLTKLYKPRASNKRLFRGAVLLRLVPRVSILSPGARTEKGPLNKAETAIQYFLAAGLQS
jgi:hypothetical protein